MGRISNVHGMLNARYGLVGMDLCVFTHRDPDNGCVWGECVKDGDGFCGWIRPKYVVWCQNE